MEINSNASNTNIITEPIQPTAVETAGNEAANNAAKTEKKSLSFQQAAAKYDVTNISPKEIDELAADLRKSGEADVRDILMLETHGAKFLSNLPDRFYGDNKLNQPINLLQVITDQLNMAKEQGTPTETSEKLLALLEKIQSQKSPTANNNLSSNMMTGLLSTQEVR